MIWGYDQKAKRPEVSKPDLKTIGTNNIVNLQEKKKHN